MSKSRYTIFAARAVFDLRMTPSERLVLAALGTYTNGEGWCHPGQATLAERLGITRQTVSGAIKKLVSLGYVETQVRTAKGRGKVGYDYRVKLDLAPEDLADIGQSRHRPEPTSAPADFGADREPMSAEPDIPYKEEQPHKNNPNLSLVGKPPKRAKRGGYSPDFEAFWQSWPKNRRELSDKRKSFERWQEAMGEHTPEIVMRAAKTYLAKADVRKENYRYCRLAQVFLNGGLEAAIEAAQAPPTKVWSSARGEWVDA